MAQDDNESKYTTAGLFWLSFNWWFCETRRVLQSDERTEIEWRNA